MELLDFLLIVVPAVGLLIIAVLEIRDAAAYRRALAQWEAAQKTAQAPRVPDAPRAARPITASVRPAAGLGRPQIIASWRHRYDVVGESFCNEDGTSRQELLDALANSRAPFEQVTVSIEPYDYQGELALSVRANGFQIGNIARKNIREVSLDLETAEGIDLFVFGGEDGKFYGAAVTLFCGSDSVADLGAHRVAGYPHRLADYRCHASDSRLDPA